MPQRRFAVLRGDIRRELDNVQRLVAEAEEWKTQLAEWPDIVRVRTGGGILNDFYCGVERIFRYVATRIDEDLAQRFRLARSTAAPHGHEYRNGATGCA